MNNVLIEGASAELRPKLGTFARNLMDYLKVHPIPGNDTIAISLVPQRLNAGLIGWKWEAGNKSEDQTVWQALADRWLNERFVGFQLDDNHNGILLRVIDDARQNAGGAKRAIEGKTMIKGEGLAEFTAIEPKFRLEDLIVPDTLKKALLEAISIVKHTELIYEKWGFKNVESTPRIVLNFFGPPGTGKTMAAHGIAEHLGKKIVMANFAEIESKYVGDSPKNLENIFRVAESESAVLFFDEADSFLGKRLTSVTSSSDQAVNSLRSKLLQLLEDYQGVVIFCTNLLKNYDKAFESRILRSLRFDLPDDECRRLLIRQKIPMQIPFSHGENLDETAISEISSIAKGFSGREIKNAVLRTLCRVALDEKESFVVNDFITGFKSAAEERMKVQQEGALPKERAETLSKVIKGKLGDGDFAETSSEKK